MDPGGLDENYLWDADSVKISKEIACRRHNPLNCSQILEIVSCIMTSCGGVKEGFTFEIG